MISIVFYTVVKFYVVFVANEIDGEDFINFAWLDICQLLPRFKLRKRFLSEWTKETKQVFEPINLTTQ